METYRLKRGVQSDIEFHGELLADISSRNNDAQMRWMEVRIYSTDYEKYVTEVIGCSAVEGEIDLVNVTVVNSPDQVKVALRRNSRVDYLTHTAVEALRIASLADPALDAASVEQV